MNDFWFFMFCILVFWLVGLMFGFSIGRQSAASNCDYYGKFKYGKKIYVCTDSEVVK